jgi:hypothetical protein
MLLKKHNNIKISMKKKLIALTICLMMISSASSQQLSNDSTVVIPIKSLRKALEIKLHYNNCKNELGISRDSIRIQDSIITTQDETIVNLVHQTEVYKANERNYEEVVENKDKILDIKDQEIKILKKNIKTLVGITIITTISFILILI